MNVDLGVVAGCTKIYCELVELKRAMCLVRYIGRNGI